MTFLVRFLYCLLCPSFSIFIPSSSFLKSPYFSQHVLKHCFTYASHTPAPAWSLGDSSLNNPVTYRHSWVGGHAQQMSRRPKFGWPMAWARGNISPFRAGTALVLPLSRNMKQKLMEFLQVICRNLSWYVCCIWRKPTQLIWSESYK